jgi:hypothetical protein
MKLLFLITFLSIFGKEPSSDGITYRALTWNDFRGPVPEKTTFAALTATQLIYEYEFDEQGKYTYTVTAYFDPASSYVRLRSEAYLRHEQTHFRIAFLMAQECMRELKPLQGTGEAGKEKADVIYARYVNAYNALNEQFDRETDHSVNVVAEKSWEASIAQQLNAITHGRNR